MEKSKTFVGFGVLLNDELVWSDQGNCLSLAIVVRDRDYPGAAIVKWSQAVTGSCTVYQVLDNT